MFTTVLSSPSVGHRCDLFHRQSLEYFRKHTILLQTNLSLLTSGAINSRIHYVYLSPELRDYAVHGFYREKRFKFSRPTMTFSS
jgi:hypothetical protein